jgi:hypothetical protein
MSCTGNERDIAMRPRTDWGRAGARGLSSLKKKKAFSGVKKEYQM